MGGLVMRRFLLDHAQDATPPIDSLITVATPYLGAPKGIYVLYTGNFFMNFGDGLTRAALREVAPFVMGVAQLLPTKAYFQVKRNAPFVEEGVDDNHNGVSTEDYMTWDQFRTYLDRKFNNVVSRGVVFHDHPGQDDFRQDGPHLPKTYQFYGNRTGSTIEQVKAATVCKRIYALAPVLGGSVPIPVVVCGDAYLPVMGPGDGTVPTVSGSKASFDVVPGAGPSVNFNPPSANLYEVTQTQASGAFDHVSITAHPCVLAGIFSVINGVMPKTCKDIDEETRVPAPERAGSVRTLAENEPGDPPAWYPRLMGITDPTLIDFSGKDSVADGTATSIESPGVDLMAVSERSTAGYLQGGRDFALTFVAGPEEPLQISVDRATDPDFPESTTIFGQIVSGDSYRLILHANGNVVLSRDVARDGTFTEEILPDSIIPSNGDRTRPVINTAAVQTVTGVEVSAGVTDDRTASPGVYYSIDGAVYVRYAGTLSLPPSSATVSFVSLDEAGNTGSATVPVAFATLSGQITGGGGATVQITSGQAQFTVAADASGGFTLPSPILLGGHVTVTPARSGFVFSPPSAQISAYDGTPILFTASGIQLASLAVRPAAAGGGTTVTLTVTLSATAGDNTTVALTSSDGSIAPVPLSIIIPAGNASGSVQFNVGVPAQFTTVTVSASLGSTTKATLFTVFPASSAPPPETQPGDTIWIDDSLPGGAALQNGYYGPLHWDRTQAAGGNQSLTNNLFGNVQYSTFVTGLNARLEIGEKVVAYVRMSDSAPAREIKLVWMTNLGYRGAYWGEALTGSENTCLNMGPLPAAGGWVRLEIPLKQLGLEQTTLTKVELAHYGGQVWFDRLGKSGVACVPAVAPQPQIVAGDTVIVDDGIPAGAALQNGYRGPMHWDPSQSASGTQSLVNYYAGDNVSYTTFVGSLNQRLEIGESVVVYAHANECAVPREIKVVWYTNLGYRGAYWGEALAGGENTCINMGPIPSGITAGWVRLEIPLKQLVLEQTTLTKIELTHFGGQVWFDHLAKGGAACIAAAAPQPQIAAGDTVIVDDGVPAGAALQNGYRGPMHWDRSQSASGTQSLVNYYAGDSVAYTTFVGSLNQRLEIGEKVVVYAHVNECAVPREIKVVWSTNLGYRGAYWGEALTGGENSCINMGPIPAGIMSGWVRLEVSLKQLGLEQTTLTKIELTHFGGQVWFDHLAKGGPACIAAVAPPPQVPAGDAVLVDDSVPAGAALQNGYYGPMHWDVSQAASGTQSLVNYYSGDAHAYTTFITGLSTPLAAGGRVVAYIHTNECAPPREIKLVWYTSGGYRGAYWGEALAGGENSCINMGAVPAAASAGWTRIEIPVNQLGVGGTTLTKIELTHFGGQVWFDRIGD
jgi:hypothetical protein